MAHTQRVRQGIVMALTWLLATAVATSVGFLAIATVGDVLRGAGPLGESFASPTAEPPVGPDTPVERTLRTEHVELVARCEGRVAMLLDVRPVAPWELVASELGPDEDVEAVLGSDRGRVRVEVYCNDGEPREVVFG